MKRTLIYFLFILSYSGIQGQLNYYEKGKKALYWGISICGNSADFSVDRQPFSSTNDTVFNTFSNSGPGFNLGLIGNWQFNKYFDLRFVPSMVFTERIMTFETENAITENRVNSTYLTFPLLLRVKSEPIKDLRIFVLGGIKYDYNIVPQNYNAIEPDRILLKKHGLSYEYGIGLQYFFPYFIFSPELKFSHSFFNMLDGPNGGFNSSTLNGLYPRTMTLSINFEG